MTARQFSATPTVIQVKSRTRAAVTVANGNNRPSLTYAGHCRSMTTMQPSYRIFEPELGRITDIYRDGGRLVKPRVDDAQLVDVDRPPHYVVVTFDDEVVVEAWTNQHYIDVEDIFEAHQTQEAYHRAQLIAHAENIEFDPTRAAHIDVLER